MNHKRTHKRENTGIEQIRDPIVMIYNLCRESLVLQIIDYKAEYNSRYNLYFGEFAINNFR